MDLNAARSTPEVREAKPLRILRLGTPEPAFPPGLDELPPPPVGEALPDSDQGFDAGHPISPEEREALQRAGFSDEDIDQISKATGAEAEDDYPLVELDEEPQGPAHPGFRTADGRWVSEVDYQDKVIPAAVHPGMVDKGIPGATRHLCFVTPCRWYLDVPPVEPDMSSLLGGASVAALEQAAEVERLLTEHLQTHTLLEWAKALRQAQDEAKRAKETFAPGIRQGYTDDGENIVMREGPAFGARQRDPARQAAVDALDARLGRKVGPPQPQDPRAVAEHDSMLRAARAARRARQPSPYDLTPRWSPELENGVVGIKR